MQGSFCVYAEKIGTGYAIRKRCMTFPIKQENRKERYFQMKKISILIPCYNEEENGWKNSNDHSDSQRRKW